MHHIEAPFLRTNHIARMSTAVKPDVQVKSKHETGKEKVKESDAFIHEAFETNSYETNGVKGRIAANTRFKEARPYPLGMIIGHEEIKQALILSAVNPRIGGVVISGRRGTCKSVLARAVHRLVPSKIERVKGSRFNIDPHGTDRIDTFLQNELESSGKSLEDMETEMVPTPFVQIPLGCMEDSLVRFCQRSGVAALRLHVRLNEHCSSVEMYANFPVLPVLADWYRRYRTKHGDGIFHLLAGSFGQGSSWCFVCR
jgi:hypothetical protein